MQDDAASRGGSALTEGLGRADKASWCVVSQDTGHTLAKGEAPTEQDAVREAGHYAIQYAQEGPVSWWVRVNRKTVLRASLAGLTISARTVKS